ncbi:MAG: HDOD domain-containing protein [Planctomycetota bacterium]|jgi:putative nucleotidyltransferase with HDIG domain
MSDKPTDPTVAPQVELVIRRLDSLSILPSVAAQCFSKLLQSEPVFSDLAEIIESDPALTARIYSLMHQQGISFTDEKFSVRDALERLPVNTIRDVLFSVKVYPAFDQDEDKILLRRQLIEHSLAVACCAEDIAENMSPQTGSTLAYSAGLLHDIGKFALDEAMPRSFSAIVKQAKSQEACICTIEQKHLGTDHTILGKRLAQKWHLPSQITLAIWLHHSDTNLISQNMPEARIGQVIQLADLIARQCGIGQSGSYDPPNLPDSILQSLAINPEQLEQIRRNLAEKVSQKSKILDLDLPNAAQSAREHAKLSLENRQLQAASSHLDFITDFLSSINADAAPIDAAENFAVRWQKFYQTGLVCLYLAHPADSQLLEAVVVESPDRNKTVILNAPVETPAIPKAIANSFVILNAQDYIGWLFEQLDVDFDLSQTKLVPLLSGGKAVGAIVFELRYPAEPEQLEEKFKATASVAGAVLDMAFAWGNQQRFAEQFAQLLTKSKETQPQVPAEPGAKETQPQIVPVDPFIALAEMAGGAAHELNNPLSVISGRAQLLAESETDPEKKRILKQIRKNTNQLAAIIDDLMTFAEPPQPRPAQTDMKQMLDEATHLAAQKTNLEQLDIQIDIADGLENVFVDSAQIVSAIANIFSNSLESYADKSGPIKVAASAENSGDFVKLEISDQGCGMDAETVQKATQPFFCSKSAGRKRGMGLAHAQRIIQLNRGSLNIASRPDSGTTVTILLPCK